VHSVHYITTFKSTLKLSGDEFNDL